MIHHVTSITYIRSFLSICRNRLNYTGPSTQGPVGQWCDGKSPLEAYNHRRSGAVGSWDLQVGEIWYSRLFAIYKLCAFCSIHPIFWQQKSDESGKMMAKIISST